MLAPIGRHAIGIELLERARMLLGPAVPVCNQLIPYQTMSTSPEDTASFEEDNTGILLITAIGTLYLPFLSNLAVLSRATKSSYRVFGLSWL